MDALGILHETSCLLLAPQKDVGKVLQDVLELLARQAGLRHGTITLLRPGTDELVITAAHGLSPDELARGRYRVGEGITGRVAAEKRSAVVPDISAEPLFLDRTRARREGGRFGVSFLCVPILRAGDLLGTLSVDRPLDDSMSLEENLRLLEVIARMLAETVRRIRENAEERLALREENERLRTQLGERFDIKNLLGRSPPMVRVKEMIQQVSPSQATVLVRGESGTGKEIVARAIHQHSPRAAGPFLAVSCAALPESLVESELFGHEKGAFTGAQARRLGRFELATGGTLFLDEIGDLSPAMQVRLLRVLQERQFERVGGIATISVDVRVIAATNRPLETLIEQGQFREDLFYRLNVFPIFLPPLRERGSDILLLADAFIEKFSQMHGRTGVRVSPRALDLLMAHHWPGNVRELENAVERAILLAGDGVIHPSHLPPSLQSQSGAASGQSLASRVALVETQIIRETLEETNGNAVQAAHALQTTPRILRYRMRQLGIDPRLFRGHRRAAAATPSP